MESAVDAVLPRHWLVVLTPQLSMKQAPVSTKYRDMDFASAIAQGAKSWVPRGAAGVSSACCAAQMSPNFRAKGCGTGTCTSDGQKAQHVSSTYFLALSLVVGVVPQCPMPNAQCAGWRWCTTAPPHIRIAFGSPHPTFLALPCLTLIMGLMGPSAPAPLGQGVKRVPLRRSRSPPMLPEHHRHFLGIAMIPAQRAVQLRALMVPIF